MFNISTSNAVATLVFRNLNYTDADLTLAKERRKPKSAIISKLVSDKIFINYTLYMHYLHVYMYIKKSSRIKFFF